MTIKTALSTGLIFLTCLFGYENGDWQFWSTIKTSGKLAGKISAEIEEEFRAGDDISSLYYHHADLGFVFHPFKNFRIVVNYRQIFEKKENNWKIESRPHLNFVISLKSNFLTVSNRGRFEYRVKTDENEWRLRNKLKFSIPKGIRFMSLKPYIADEIFIELSPAHFSRNRFYIGLQTSPHKKIRIETFYLLQSSLKNEHWKNYNIIGVKIKMKF